jgi:glycosyltransferase involved in cell wall biosynthesis
MSAAIRVLELRTVAGTGGGPDKTIIAGARLTPPSDVAVTACYLCNEGDDAYPIGDLAKRAGIDYAEIRERHSFDPRTVGAVRRLIRERRIQIVHSHDHKADVLAYLLSKVAPFTPVSTAHGFTGHSWRERRLYYPLDRTVLARFPKVIAVSSELKNALVGAGADPTRIEVVLNGIEPERFRRLEARRAPARAAFGLDTDDVVLGAVGRLEPQKRFDLLIDAFVGIAAAVPRARLVIAGDGSLRASLGRQIAARGLGGAAHLVGHVSDVVEFHQALDVFVQSSAYEGTPNVVLEAMAMETPIVATAAGGTDELVEDGVHGLIVRSGDGAALGEAILQVLGDRDAARARAVAARARVETALSFEARVRRITAIYGEVLSRTPARVQ